MEQAFEKHGFKIIETPLGKAYEKRLNDEFTGLKTLILKYPVYEGGEPLQYYYRLDQGYEKCPKRMLLYIKDHQGNTTTHYGLIEHPLALKMACSSSVDLLVIRHFVMAAQNYYLDMIYRLPSRTAEANSLVLQQIQLLKESPPGCTQESVHQRELSVIFSPYEIESPKFFILNGHRREQGVWQKKHQVETWEVQLEQPTHQQLYLSFRNIEVPNSGLNLGIKAEINLKEVLQKIEKTDPNSWSQVLQYCGGKHYL